MDLPMIELSHYYDLRAMADSALTEDLKNKTLPILINPLCITSIERIPAYKWQNAPATFPFTKVAMNNGDHYRVKESPREIKEAVRLLGAEPIPEPEQK